MPEIKRIIDLSPAIEPGMRLFPGMAEPSLTRIKTHPEHGLQSTRLEMSAHAGSHVDAPRHFLARGRTIDQVPLAALVGQAVVFDLRHLSPGQAVTRADLERQGLEVGLGDIVILNTGWQHYRDPGRYCFLAPEAAEWLIGRRIKGLALDAPSLDPVPRPGTRASRETHPAHHLILKAGIAVVECLTNLEALSRPRVFFCCLPLNLAGSEAAPARAVALEFD